MGEAFETGMQDTHILTLSIGPKTDVFYYTFVLKSQSS